MRILGVVPDQVRRVPRSEPLRTFQVGKGIDLLSQIWIICLVQVRIPLRPHHLLAGPSLFVRTELGDAVPVCFVAVSDLVGSTSLGRHPNYPWFDRRYATLADHSPLLRS